MVLCIHHLLTLLCMCVCAHTLSSNLYLHPTQPVCCYLCIFQPPRQHTFITAPDSGIGNLSLILISLKLQFTWIFVGVLRAGCSLADAPAPSLSFFLSLSLSLPLRLGGNVSTQQQSLKVTFQSDISKRVMLVLQQKHCFFFFLS